jgi:curli biogenesis system outer membrane secretion channel CsgG
MRKDHEAPRGYSPSPRGFFLFVALACPAVLAAIPPAIAQESSLHAAAAQIADALSHSKHETVIVFDFTGPGNKATALGQKLADDFSASLAKSARHFRVEDRSRAADMLADYRITIATDNDPQLMSWLAQNLNAQALVTGQLSLGGHVRRVRAPNTPMKQPYTKFRESSNWKP